MSEDSICLWVCLGFFVSVGASFVLLLTGVTWALQGWS
jgi:hypothetical protein